MRVGISSLTDSHSAVRMVKAKVMIRIQFLGTFDGIFFHAETWGELCIPITLIRTDSSTTIDIAKV